jgi:HlyD family secretion protein
MLMGLVLISGFIFGWVEHHLRVRAAEAALKSARLTREAAEIAMVEYLQGIYQQDIEEVEAEISLAEAKLKGAEQSIGRSNRLPTEADTAPAAGRVAGEKAVERARDALAQAQEKRRTLEEITKPQTIAELNSEITSLQSEPSAQVTRC